ncbi:MAG: Ig-like domain-containing protein, partial [Flaviflexus sp.]|nr:Ig-like domain-containing protein [Flaviflexus sp.]
MRTRAIAGLSALCLGLAVVPASAAAPELDLGVDKGGGVTITTEQQFIQDGAKDECLSAVVRWRQDALNDNVRWNVGGEETTVRQYLADNGIAESQYLDPKWSLDLEYVAMQRVAETAVHSKIAHKRLTDDAVNTATRGGMGALAAEILAWGPPTCTRAIDQWATEKADWVNQTPNAVTGHYTTLINPTYLSYGFAGVSNADVPLTPSYSVNYVWAGLGEAKASPNESATNIAGLYSVPMNVDPAALTDVTVSNSEVAVGETINPTVIGQVYGTTATLSGEWATDDPAIATASEAGLTGVAPGTTTASVIMSNGKKASFTLTVVGASITSLELPSGVTTESGTAPVLPETVTANYSDGSTGEVPVTWEPVDEADYSAREGGTFTVNGTVEGVAEPVSIEVTVNPATVESVASVEVSTVAGDAPVLPGTVEVTWSNGDVTEESVAWPVVDEADYAAPGTFTVTGTAAGADVTATVTVTEAPVELVGVENPAGVTTESGTAPVLPETVTANYSDGSTGEVPVTWEPVDEADYSAREGGTFTVNGTVEGVAEPVSIEVTVNPATVESVASVEVSTVAGDAPVLPGTVEVTWSNGDVTEESVAWPVVDEADYAAPGTFTVTGTAAGADVPGTVTVTEAAPVITSVEDPAEIATNSGTAPVLPETVTADYSDGSTGEVPVTWEPVDEADYSYRGGGTFTVSGTVEGAEDPVTATVKVIPAEALEVVGVEPVETVEGVAPVLPESAEVSWSNGDTS